jgi:hypothetical protein
VTSAAFIIRAVLSGLIVAAIAMLAKRSPALGILGGRLRANGHSLSVYDQHYCPLWHSALEG